MVEKQINSGVGITIAPELKPFESIVSKDIPNLIRKRGQVCNVLVADFQKAMSRLSEQVKVAMTNRVAHITKRKQLRKYIRVQQQSIIILNSNLADHANPDKLAVHSDVPEPATLCRYIFKALEGLLAFMEKHFTGYFNADAWLPRNYRMIVAEEIRQDMDKLETALIGQVDARLVTVISLEFWQFLDQELASQVTWRKARYLKALQNELLTLLRRHEITDKTTAIRSLLISLNFNSAEFFTFYTNTIVVELEAIGDESLRPEKLTLYNKEISKVQDRHGYVLDINAPGIKEQLASWMGKELSFHQQLSLDFDQPITGSFGDTKLNFDMPVPELSIFLFAMKKTNVLLNKSMIKVFQLMSQVSTTVQADKLSPEGLRTRYNTREHRSKLNVIKMLRKMADFLESN